jgi:hypothetical protein
MKNKQSHWSMWGGSRVTPVIHASWDSFCYPLPFSVTWTLWLSSDEQSDRMSLLRVDYKKEWLPLWVLSLSHSLFPPFSLSLSLSSPAATPREHSSDLEDGLSGEEPRPDSTMRMTLPIQVREWVSPKVLLPGLSFRVMAARATYSWTITSWETVSQQHQWSRPRGLTHRHQGE